MGDLLLNYGYYTFKEVLKSRGVTYYYTAASSVSSSLFCLPSEILKIGLGLDSVFLFWFSTLPSGLFCGMCWWRIFYVSTWLLGTCLFRVTRVVCSPSPFSPQPHAPGMSCFVYSPARRFVRAGWREAARAVQSVLVLAPHMRTGLVPLPGKLMDNDSRYTCELFCVLWGALCGCIGCRAAETWLIFVAKCVLEVTSSMGTNDPCVHCWWFLEISGVSQLYACHNNSNGLCRYWLMCYSDILMWV